MDEACSNYGALTSSCLYKGSDAVARNQWPRTDKGIYVPGDGRKPPSVLHRPTSQRGLMNIAYWLHLLPFPGAGVLISNFSAAKRSNKRSIAYITEVYRNDGKRGKLPGMGQQGREVVARIHPRRPARRAARDKGQPEAAALCPRMCYHPR